MLFFGDTPIEQRDSGNYRHVRFDLGSAAIYLAAIDLNHPNPPETLRSIPVEVRRDLTAGHTRYFRGFRGRKFEDNVSVIQGMVGEIPSPSDLDNPVYVAKFMQLHDIDPESTLRYMGISPAEPHVASNFTFDMEGQIVCMPQFRNEWKTEFNEVMDYLVEKKFMASEART